MGFRDRLLDVAPHYLVTLVLIFAALVVLRGYLGVESFWQEMVVMAAIVFAYPVVVRELGYAPRSWQRDTETDTEENR